MSTPVAANPVKLVESVESTIAKLREANTKDTDTKVKTAPKKTATDLTADELKEFAEFRAAKLKAAKAVAAKPTAQAAPVESRGPKPVKPTHNRWVTPTYSRKARFDRHAQHAPQQRQVIVHNTVKGTEKKFVTVAPRAVVPPAKIVEKLQRITAEKCAVEDAKIPIKWKNAADNMMVWLLERLEIEAKTPEQLSGPLLDCIASRMVEAMTEGVQKTGHPYTQRFLHVFGVDQMFSGEKDDPTPVNRADYVAAGKAELEKTHVLASNLTSGPIYGIRYPSVGGQLLTKEEFMNKIGVQSICTRLREIVTADEDFKNVRIFGCAKQIWLTDRETGESYQKIVDSAIQLQWPATPVTQDTPAEESESDDADAEPSDDVIME
ncbi:MAG: hypothetical protein Faunusvirus22_13 [Faunusvirus sp.]|jgi:hypothetical protein|uniref:Uncharacterized protein n=1 Tax=Faunusvirus sp. TaxID=2487766 RepID=A0A3G4ZXD0_9VIRU|nr:MAG: hypothetical protein Faunusvirus22_13 [Faunusvirus sp.]